MGLFTAKLPLPCVSQSGRGNAPSVRDTVVGQVGIAQPDGPERLTHTTFLLSTRDRLFEGADRLADPAGERLGSAEHRNMADFPRHVLRRLTQRKATLESRN